MSSTIYRLEITCPKCKTKAVRASTGPFLYLDEQGIIDHAQHTTECAGGAQRYFVLRDPLDYRQLPGDPAPPSEGGA